MGSRSVRRAVVLLTTTAALGFTTSCSEAGDVASATTQARADTSSPTPAPSTPVEATGSTTTIRPTLTTTTSAPPITDAPTTMTPSSTIAAAPPNPAAVDPAWVIYPDEFFVWGVATDDRLNVRSGAGVSHPVVTTLGPGATGLRLFDVVQFVGSARWGAIELPGGAGWVNLGYLRPVGSNPPTIRGTADPAMSAAADTIRALLARRDFAALSGHVDPALGVAISPYAFISAETQVLSPQRIISAATDTSTLLWGFTDGEGARIEETIAEHLGHIGDDRGLTSTNVIGFDGRVGFGNSIDNVATWFPGSTVVEYHFDGTELYRDFDWSSVRFVFDTTVTAPNGFPALIAIVQDSWTV